MKRTLLTGGMILAACVAAPAAFARDVSEVTFP